MKSRPATILGALSTVTHAILVTRFGMPLAGLLLVGSTAVNVVAKAGPSNRSPNPCELGIQFALSGQEARAESAFVAMLSVAPACALNNLGNLHLRRGEHDVAVEFYRAASQFDTSDAGIVLNVATARMLVGDHSGARDLAEEAVRRAGSVEVAAGLLGVPFHESKVPVADRTRARREQTLQLLRTAVRGISSDSTAHWRAPVDSSRASKGKRVPFWRSTGGAGASPILYWKR